MRRPGSVLIGLGLVLLGGLAWFWFSSDLSGPGPQTLEPSAPGEVAPQPREDSDVAALPKLNGTDEERAGLTPRKGGTDRRGLVGGHVTLTVRAADGRTIRDALAGWGLEKYRLTCVGTRRSPGLLTYGSISAAKPPHRFATMDPNLVEGHTTFTVLVTQRPSFLSVVFAGVVIAIERVSEGETEVLVELTESEVRAALGSLHLCMVGGPTKGLRSRAYLRSEDLNQLTAESDGDGCATFLNVAPGEYQLSVHANRLASYFASVNIEPSLNLDLGDVALEPPVHLAGSVVGMKRFTANRLVVIQAVDRSEGELRTVELRRVSTDSRGRFRIFDLPAGEYALRVVPPALVSGTRSAKWPVTQPVIVDTRGGPRQDVELDLQDAHGVVVRNGMDYDVDLDIRTSIGVTVKRLHLAGKGVRSIAMLGGTYVLVASSRGKEVSRSTFRTPPSMTAIVGG